MQSYEELLLEDLYKAAEKLSFYNAAESGAWFKEAGARNKAENIFTKSKRACDAAGVEYDLKSYLV